ncbi:MAG TPA: TraB/GumN family protein [Burkholderiales bacterium]|nr:TraB/GumN family protein [Burkholderiales bacterium]
MRSSANWISRNRSWVSRCAVAGVLALAAAALEAQTPPPFVQGLLWRIAKAGVPDSFAFGTIHVADPRVTIAQPVGDALARSRTLALELGSQVASDEVLELEQLQDGQRLQPLIGEDTFKRVRIELAAQDVPERLIERMKPWAAMIKVARAQPRSSEPGLDQQLLVAAHARGVKVMALEWVEEQIAAFDAVPLETQVALLKHALADHAALEAGLDATIDAWLRGDLARLAKLSAGSHDRFSEMGRHYLQLTKHIIHDRNVLMHHRLVMPLRGGRVFVAVGALHLHGEKGLLAMIARDGYRVTRLY